MSTWIWPENGSTENAYVRFESCFTLVNAAPAQASVSVSGEYVLFINGKMAGFGQYTDWPERRAVNTHDLTDFCHPGENIFLLIVWHQNLNCSVDVIGPARAWFEVRQEGSVLLESAAGFPCREDSRYCQGPIWKITGQLGYGFEYNACAELPPLRGAAEVPGPGKMHPRPLSPVVLEALRAGEPIAQGVFWDTAPDKPLGVRMRRAALSQRTPEELQGTEKWLQADTGDGIYLVYDLGQETAGYLHLEADFTQDTEVLIGYGEHLQDLRVRTDIDGRCFCVRYHAKAGSNDFTHWFRRLGGRYLQLHIGAPQVRIRQIGLIPAIYPTGEPQPFHCHDSLHRRICEVGCHTLKLCMHTHYEDTPWREQALYAMDGRLQMLCGYYAFREFDMPRESLRLLANGQREDGLLELCAPAKVSVTIPAFSLSFIQAVWEYVLHTGDRDFGKEMTPVIERILSAFARRCDPQGRLSCFTEPQYWNFYEWRTGLDDGEVWSLRGKHRTPYPDGLLTACYLLALNDTQRLCDEAGLSLPGLEEKRRHALQGLRTFWNEEKGLFAAFIKEQQPCVYASLMQSLVLLSGAADDQQSALLRAKLAANEEMIPVTLNCALFRYQALLQDEEAYKDFVFREIGEIWGKMLLRNATSFWETESGEKDFHRAGSLCHGWSAIPVYFYYAYPMK